MNLRNLFRKKQIFTATFAGITVTRRGYEHEKEYTWHGQASLFGIDCLLEVCHRTDDEFRCAEREYLLGRSAMLHTSGWRDYISNTLAAPCSPCDIVENTSKPLMAML